MVGSVAESSPEIQAIPTKADNKCKICGSADLTVFAHTAKCGDCGTLLFYPYPVIQVRPGNIKSAEAWYNASSFYNHDNFTRMIRFAMGEADKRAPLSILDYGGGGGQFAPVLLSHFPDASVYLVDILDAVHPCWKPMQTVIPFGEFERHSERFDVIFLNDVFEHVENPAAVLSLLSGKLKPGGRIFIDTPKQFWIYPITKLFSKALYTKVLKGTVSMSHLQIWTEESFAIVVSGSGLAITKKALISEYTMPANFYLNAMQLTNPVIRFIGRIFYRTAKMLARNKIICLLQQPTP